MSGLNVVCLISGGKDSLFSILHCLANGHNVIALANLHPPHQEHDTPEDLDSYMYQTIGHAVIPLYEQALGLPLYRQEVSGSAVNKDKCYGPGTTPQPDETEDLVPLLNKVKTHHPELNAVSTGAILSDYQRTRVESVALRLGLAPLSYLWQWPHLPPFSPTSLLEDMAAIGQDSRIIKVASGGLDESLLWQNVSDRRTLNRLMKIAQRFGTVQDGAVLGEGGEYETLAVAGPSPLWKGRIVVDDDMRTIVTGEAGSASVKLMGAKVEPKEDRNGAGSQEVRRPPLLEAEFVGLLSKLNDIELVRTPSQAAECKQLQDDSRSEDAAPAEHEVFLGSITGHGQDAAQQMRSILEQIEDQLRQSGHQMTDIAYTSVVLRDMAEFPAINAVYGSYFTAPNPPARITFACANVIPPGKQVVVSATSVQSSDPNSCKGLHVQSRSYWAPANIGPYSQAKTVPIQRDNGETADLVYLAGQIPLMPASMELPTPDTRIDQSGTAVEGVLDSGDVSFTDAKARRTFNLQAVLSIQHFDRIGRVMGVEMWLPAMALIVASSDDDAKQKSFIAHQAWNEYHRTVAADARDDASHDEDSDTFDVWDLKNDPSRRFYAQPEIPEVSRSGIQREIPELHVVRVDALPRGSSIEWVTYGLTGHEARSADVVSHLRHLLDVFQDNIVA